MNTLQLPLVVYSVPYELALRDIRTQVTEINFNRVAPGLICGQIDDRSVVLVFKFGAVVFVNIAEDRHAGFLMQIGLDEIPKSKFETEEFVEDDCIIEVVPGELKVQFNKVIIPEWNLEMVYIVGWAMAQSCSLEFVERDVSEALTQSAKLSASLRESKWFRFKRKDLLSVLGNILETRHAIVGKLRLFNEPDSTWEWEQCDRLYRLLFDHFDINRRVEHVERTLAISADTGELQLEMINTWRGEFLEIVIILLIAFEVVQALVGVLH